MYAVIKTGGKQYRVSEGDVIEVEHLSVKRDRATFTPILVVTDDGKTVYGAKNLKAFTVTAKVVGDAKGDKIHVLKYRPKTGHAAKTGHRQLYSLIEIVSIGEKGAKKAEAEQPEEAEAETAADPPAPEPEAPAAEAPDSSEPAASAPDAAEGAETPAPRP